MASGQNGTGGGGDEIECHLYSYDYSLCSLMTRYMVAVCGQPGPGVAALKIDDTEIDIHGAFDQLNEWYLRDVSPQGQVRREIIGSFYSLIRFRRFQVPAFRLETKPPTIIADSLEIADFFLPRYPSLQAPANQEAKLAKLLKELHRLDFFAICFTATNAPVSANPRIHAKEKTLERLDSQSISPEYRKALNHKLQVWVPNAPPPPSMFLKSSCHCRKILTWAVD